MMIGLGLALPVLVYGYLIARFGTYWLPPVQRLSYLWDWEPLAALPALGVGALLAFIRDAGQLEKCERLLRWLLPITIPATAFLSANVAAWAAGLHPALYWIPAPLGQVLVMAWLIARAVIDGPSASSWGGRFLPALGAISYGVYVYHHPLRSFIDSYDPSWTLVAPRLLGVAATICIAGLSYRLFERPLRQFGRGLTGTGAILSPHRKTFSA
jgi:peptidoglycan/LPS O-acetylase OafA/YrhL